MAGRWVAGVALSLGMMASAAQAGSPAEQRFWLDAKQDSVRRQQSQIVRVAKRALPAVVAITTRSEPTVEQVASGTDGEPQKGLGSGFIIHPDGYILTSSHVIEGASQILITLLEPRGGTREYEAEVIGHDPETDFALLKIDAGRKLPILALGTAKNVQVADWVVVIGNPFGLAHSVSVGVISYKGRTDVTPSGRTGYFDYLQTDASINPGNSGGPVLDLNGNVVAIANAVNTSGQGIGFALPIDMAKEVLPDLKQRGMVRRGWMGISVEDITPDLALERELRAGSGVLISEVVENSPAAKAGLKVGDVIVGMGKAKVRKAHALRWRVATADVGRTVHLMVRRHGRPLFMRVKLGAMPSPESLETDPLARTPAKPRPDGAVAATQKNRNET